MKKGFHFLSLAFTVVLVCTIMFAGAGEVFAAGEDITLKLDGSVVQTEVPPIIISGRTMTPAKFLFEAMGGKVEWIAETRQVKVALNDTSVLLTINSNTAQVNGQTKTMDVAPIIKNQRTLIPTSFVAQELGCGVTWINDTRTVEITSAPAAPKVSAKINYITTERVDSGIYRVMIQSDQEIKEYKAAPYDAPSRFVLDIYNAELTVEREENEGHIKGDGQLFSQVRFSQFEPTTVRVVADLEGETEGSVSLSADKKTIYMVLKMKTELPPDNPVEKPQMPDQQGVAADITGMGIPELDPGLSDRLVVIDPGHGGTDSGSLGKDSTGKTVQMEKDLNLAIALRLNELLRGAGVNTYMLRTDDSSMTLYARPAKANELNASLYVAVHNNSNESPTPSGTETHYYNKPDDPSYGYTSKAIADTVQSELVKTLRLKDRKTKSSPSLAVLNKTQMPAIIIEGAFISNPAELAFMMTDEFKEAYALGAARGIVKALNQSVEN